MGRERERERERGRGGRGGRGKERGEENEGRGAGNIPQGSLPALLCPVSGYVLQSFTEKLILCLYTPAVRDT